MRAHAELPVGWKWVELGDVLSDIEAGRSFKALDRPAAGQEWGVLKVSCVSWGEFRPEENKALPAGIEAQGIPTPRRGDLLISRANTTALVGAVVIVPEDQPRLILSDKILKLVPRPSLADPRYLLYVLRSPTARTHIESHATGTSGSMHNVSQANIRRCPLPLPPLAEQRRIADLLDKAHAIRRKRQEALALTAELLRSAFLDWVGDPLRNSHGWPTATLGELLAEGPTNGYSPRSARTATGTPSLRLSAITLGYLDLRPETIRPLDEHLPEDSKYWLKTGDLLIQRSNTREYVGTAALFNGPSGTYSYPDTIMRIRLLEHVDTRWVWRLLNSPTGRAHIRRIAAGSAGSMPKINGTKLKQLPILTPPLEAQRRIADLLDEIAALGQKHQNALTFTEPMIQALFKHAFQRDCG